MDENKIWKDVIDYEGYYSVSNYGDVYSHKRNIYKKQPIRSHGYKTVQLFNDYKSKSFLVHRIVAIAFLENLELKKQVNHKDSNKLNNHISNLEWVTHQENTIHSFKSGKRNTKYPRIWLRKKVIMIDSNKNKVFNSITNASKETNISRTAIMNCLSGISKSAGNKKWKYAN